METKFGTQKGAVLTAPFHMTGEQEIDTGMTDEEYQAYIETILDEADKYAELTDERLTREEIFENVKKNLRLGRIIKKCTN